MPKEWEDLVAKFKTEHPEWPKGQTYAIATKIYKKRHEGRTPQQDEMAAKQKEENKAE